MDSDEIGRKLDAITAILKLVYHEELAAARTRVRSDKAYAVILDSTKKWTAAAKVQAAAKKKGVARSTTSKKIAELITLGLVERRGGSTTLEYRATGLI
jgi:hypothetical protein